jgi:flagellar assembly protein FliH
MSTSCSPARASQPRVEPFAYADLGQGSALRQAVSGSSVDDQHARALGESREAGRRDAEAQFRSMLEQRIEQERQRVTQAVEAFAQERQHYYAAVEAEVVQLALAIARKILHREAQVDRLLLAGIVRVALEKLKINTDVVLRTHPQHAGEWREYFAKVLEGSLQPKIMEDAAVSPDVCVLQTQLGTTQLGIEPQLKEIEAGLIDIMAKKPVNER